MAAILEVTEDMDKAFQKFDPAPRRGEAEVLLATFHCAGGIH
jgi:hypothetical protein